MAGRYGRDEMTDDLRFIGSNVYVWGGLFDDVILSYCDRCNEITIRSIQYDLNAALTIARAHSFIINSVNGIESPVAESI